MLRSAVSDYIDRIVDGRGPRQRVITQPRPGTDIDQAEQKPMYAATSVELPKDADSDSSMSIREVPSWQVRPNGVMSLLSAGWRSPDQMGRACGLVL